MLMLLKMLAAGQSQRRPSTLNGGFPPGSRNQPRQRHHKRAEAGSIAHLTDKSPTSRTAESPSTSQDSALHVCLEAATHAGFAKRENSTLGKPSGKKRWVYEYFKQEVKNTMVVSLSVWRLTLGVYEQQTQLSLRISHRDCYPIVFCAGTPHLHGCLHSHIILFQTDVMFVQVLTVTSSLFPTSAGLSLPLRHLLISLYCSQVSLSGKTIPALD